MSIQSCQDKINKLTGELREEIAENDDLQEKAVLETVAEVLQGAATALEHCREGKEKAFRSDA